MKRLVSIGMILLTTGCGGGGGSAPQPAPPPPVAVVLDLASVATGNGFIRVSGATSTGRFGVPVASGFDCDNDGLIDFAMSAMQASPLGRSNAGLVHLIFGDGSLTRDIDTAAPNPNVLNIAGAGPSEAAGSEIWMDDVSGDGIGDLLIGRQNFREPGTNRIGAGALSILIGGSELRDLATNGTTLDLAAPAGARVLTIIGAAELDRFGFWFRTGDVTGDGIADILVGADQEDSATGESNSGAVWLIRGGAHLDTTSNIDLAEFGSTALAGQILKITPPAGAADYHFGSTVALADLDNNLRAEVLIAASLARAGGILVADGAPADSATRNGGNPGGSLFIFWDDNFAAGTSWTPGLTLSADAAPASYSRIDGGTVTGLYSNLRFAEEMIGGLDYDNDGTADLFVGDIRGSTRTDRIESGVGHVFFAAAGLRNRSFRMDAVPADISVTTILGIATGTISADTSLHGDLDGDGIVDLAISSPLANPFGRIHAGTVHVLWGQPGPWPELIDLLAGSRPADFEITDIYGAHGATSDQDLGDTLMYSAVAADIDADGLMDMVINEMRGNGVDATALDVGNLIILSGGLLPR